MSFMSWPSIIVKVNVKFELKIRVRPTVTKPWYAANNKRVFLMHFTRPYIGGQGQRNSFDFNCCCCRKNIQIATHNKTAKGVWMYGSLLQLYYETFALSNKTNHQQLAWICELGLNSRYWKQWLLMARTISQKRLQETRYKYDKGFFHSFQELSFPSGQDIVDLQIP